jgi:hypothetical protein
VPSRKIAPGAAQQLEASGQSVTQRLGREQREPACRELDGQREPVEPATDVRDRVGVLVGQGEVRADRPGALDEQLDSVVPSDHIGRSGFASHRRQAEWIDSYDLLEPDAKRLSAGDQNGDAGTIGQQLGDDPGRLRHLLEVVEQEEHLAIAKAFDELIAERPLGRLADAEDSADRG